MANHPALGRAEECKQYENYMYRLKNEAVVPRHDCLTLILADGSFAAIEPGLDPGARESVGLVGGRRGGQAAPRPGSDLHAFRQSTYH